MRILAMTWDGGGNLPPLVGLVDALTPRGHEVQVIAHQTQRGPLEAAGAEVRRFIHGGERDAGAQHVGGAAFFEWLVAFDRRAAQDLIEAVGKVRPDVIVVDAMMPVTLQAAQDSGIASVSLVHCAWGPLAEMGGAWFRKPTETSDLALVFSYRAFDPATGGDNFLWAGPARGRPSSAAWSRRRPDLPLVLASLSTAQQGQGQTLENLAAALASVNAEALLTVGRGFDPATFAGTASLTVQQEAPHEPVLEQADLLVTHGGHGTVMAGLASATPMLCLPGIGDQPFNAGRVAELGLGEVLASTSSADVIAAAITRLLADEPLHERARAFALTLAGQADLNAAIARLEAIGARAA